VSSLTKEKLGLGSQPSGKMKLIETISPAINIGFRIGSSVRSCLRQLFELIHRQSETTLLDLLREGRRGGDTTRSQDTIGTLPRSVPSLVLGFQLLFERLPITFPRRQRVALCFETAFAADDSLPANKVGSAAENRLRCWRITARYSTIEYTRVPFVTRSSSHH
jgi:hypothetical protein